MFKKMIGEKREYRAYRNRVEALPEEYRKAMTAIEKYMWGFAKGAGMLGLLQNVLEMFENSASDGLSVKEVVGNDGLSVKEVVGNDIAGFCDALLAEFPEETWMDKMRKKLRDSVE